MKYKSIAVRKQIHVVPKMSTVKENRVIFVRNIPYSITKEKLEDRFSEFGPIKQCFIVKQKGSDKSRGFGYVTFSVFEDAKRAKESKVSLDGRQVSIEYADITKKKKTPRKQRKDDDDDEEGKEDDVLQEDKIKKESDDEADTVDNKKMGTKQQTMKYHKAKIVYLSGLPDNMTDSELNNCIHKMGVKQLAECKLLTSGKCAHLKFKCIRDAKRAIRKLHNHAYKDTMLQAIQMSKDTSTQPQNVLKKSRVIVRNLSFQCSEEQLHKAFEHCGEITEVKVPTNADGKKLGFGFVQFTSLYDANKAVDLMNTHKILGRPVAVDWALPKAKYEMTQIEKEASDDEEEDDSESGMSVDDEPNKEDKDKTKSFVKVKDEPMSDDDEGVEDGESSSDDEEADDDNDVDSDEDVVEKSKGNKKVQKMESEDEDDSEEDDVDEENDIEMKGSSKQVKRNVNMKSDTDDGCTLFLRNLSFDTTEEGLEEYFAEYGPLKYAKIVMNPETEHSKGLGFVRFCMKEAATKCLQAGEAAKIALDGRQLYVSLAVSREKAATFREKKNEEKKDNRNLHLAREGMIRPGTQGAEGLSKIDLDKRMKVEEVKRQKLKNVNIFISPLRLCVRNIPINIDDKQLRTVFKEAAGDPKAFITECRIMRDRARGNSEGVGKSMGFGFVCFTDHQHALAALRHANNNPDIFGDKKRLIVEFSLENRKALETKERRKEKQEAKKEFEKTKAEDTKPRKFNIKSKTSNIPLIRMSEKDKKLKGDNLQKGLPSHWGPKIRHKQRPTQTNKGKKKQQSRQQEQKGQKRKSEAPVQIKQKRRKQEDYDDFDKIVNKYKNKLLSKKGGSKWFE